MQNYFSPSFLWGASISSYQCEGDNYNCDWFFWEKTKELNPCGKACNHYNLFDEDFKLAKTLNLNSLRLSIEWPRIKPTFDSLDQQAIGHYDQVINSLLKYDLKPIVTLHHFTNPIWFIERGGWLSSKNIDAFLEYLRLIVSQLCNKVEYWLIFNEPLVYLYNGYISGLWPPGIKSLNQALKVYKNIIRAYLIGYQEIKSIYKDIGKPVKISLAQHFRDFKPCDQGIKSLNSLIVNFRNKYFNYDIVEKLLKNHSLDFLGVNYYCREYVSYKWPLGIECQHNHEHRRNQLNWTIDADSFYDILLRLKQYNIPLLITENGTSEVVEKLYEDYLLSHLKSVVKAREAGVQVIGYQWWSLLDNFEWDKGFTPRFGLIEVDYSNFKRTLRPFAYTYSKICKEGRI